MHKNLCLLIAATALLGACTTVPEGPSVLVLPGTGKSFDQFRADDFECRQFATQQMGGATPNTVAADSGVRSAVVGTLLGAAVGAAANGSYGAGVGAGTGLAMGGLIGTGTAQASAYGAQQRYDNGFVQCMYAKGHRVPVTGHFSSYQPPQHESSIPPQSQRPPQ